MVSFDQVILLILMDFLAEHCVAHPDIAGRRQHLGKGLDVPGSLSGGSQAIQQQTANQPRAHAHFGWRASDD